MVEQCNVLTGKACLPGCRSDRTSDNTLLRLGIIWGAGIMMINGIKNEDFLFIIFNMLQSCIPLKVLFIIILIDYCEWMCRRISNERFSWKFKQPKKLSVFKHLFEWRAKCKKNFIISYTEEILLKWVQVESCAINKLQSIRMMRCLSCRRLVITIFKASFGKGISGLPFNDYLIHYLFTLHSIIRRFKDTFACVRI